jgi:hypothetical protein
LTLVEAAENMNAPMAVITKTRIKEEPDAPFSLDIKTVLLIVVFPLVLLGTKTTVPGARPCH